MMCQMHVLQQFLRIVKNGGMRPQSFLKGAAGSDKIMTRGIITKFST